MKDNEIEYLDKLFASSSDVNNEVDIEYPLLDVPDGLNRKLHAITEPSLVSTATVKRGFFERWPKVTSIAASLLVTVVGFQFYQQTGSNAGYFRPAFKKTSLNGGSRY